MQSINWSELKTSHGDGDLLPIALDKLRSLNENEREWARWNIDNNAILQSDLYEAAYYIIEPLIEIIEDPNCIDFYRPLDILIELAIGKAPEARLITIDENDVSQTLPLESACKRKFKSLKNRLSGINLSKATDKDKEEMEFLLSCI